MPTILAVVRWSPIETKLEEVEIPDSPADKRRLLRRLREMSSKRLGALHATYRNVSDMRNSLGSGLPDPMSTLCDIATAKMLLVHETSFAGRMQRWCHPTIPNNNLQLTFPYMKTLIGQMNQGHSALASLEQILQQVKEMLDAKDPGSFI